MISFFSPKKKKLLSRVHGVFFGAGGTHTSVCMWKPEDNFVGLIFFYL